MNKIDSDAAIPGDVYDDCRKIGGTHYNDLGFFRPHLRGINHLAVGRSRIISSPLTISLELIYRLYMRIRDSLHALRDALFPKDMNAVPATGRLDSELVGSLVFSGKLDENTPIHNMHVVFWARTWLLQWRKLAEGRTDAKGRFCLRFPLGASRGWGILQRRFEIYQTHYRYRENEERVFDYSLFKSISIKGGDLVGLRYNLHTIQLFYWEYRDDVSVPRVVIKDHDRDAPQYYSQGRHDALNQQFVPIELTKLKHLEQIHEGPGSLTIEKIQHDYPINLTVCMERKLPGITRGDTWFGERMMNGMYAATFEPVEGHEGEFRTRLFGACHYDINHDYAFPSVDIRFGMDEAGHMQPLEIQLTGPLNRHEQDPYQVHHFTPADGDRWMQAKRVARVTGALATELDDHFAGTHLVTEQYAIAAYRNLRLSPLAPLLFPHLKEVVLVNHSADAILIAPAKEKKTKSIFRSGGVILWLEDRINRALNKFAFESGGYIPEASALTARGISQRTRDLMGVQDWKDWQPMTPVSSHHYFALAQNAYWEMLVEYVDTYIDANIGEIEEHWQEIYNFSQDLVTHSVPVFLSGESLDALGAQDRPLAEQRLQWYAQRYGFKPEVDREVIDGELKVVSPLTRSVTFDAADVPHLKKLCSYCIMMSTFMHSFVNEHQYDDIGEVLYNSLGLRFGDGENGVLAPESDTRIAPSLTRSTQMMWWSNLLSRTEYGFIERNEEGDINPDLVCALHRYQEKIELGGKGVLISNIESRTNI